jgi:protein-L-isoaspartate O-methyltransferase
MNNAAQIKRALQSFYREESMMRDEEAWLQAGNSPRVPESRASHHFIDRKVATALALAQTSKDAKVLEVGCSFGHMTFILTQVFREVVAVDLSHESLELAQKRVKYYGVKNVRFLWADAEDLSLFDDNTFDAVFAFSPRHKNLWVSGGMGSSPSM